MGEAVELKNYTVEIDGETYSVLSVPKPESGLVQKEKVSVLRGISLDKLLRNLSSAGKYLDLAYNGTAGTMVQSKVSNLSKGLMNLTNDALVAITSLERKTEQILKDLGSTFDWLLKGKESVALKKLTRAGERAEKMADEAQELSDKFFSMSEKTQEVVSLSIDEKTLNEKKRQEMLAKKAEIEAEDIRAKQLIKDLGESRARLEDLYKEAKEKAERAEDKAFAAAIVGAIFGALAQGVGAFAGVYAGAKTGGVAVPPSPPVKQDGSGTEPTVEPVVEPTDGEGPGLKNEGVDVGGEIGEEPVESEGSSDGTASEAGAEDGTDTGEGGETQQDPEKGVKTEEPEPSTTTGTDPQTKAEQDKKKAAAASAAAGALGDVGRTTEKMGGSFEAVAVQYQQEKLKYFDLIQQSLAKEREALADIAKFAKLLSSSQNQVLALDQAVAGLYQAIGALKRIGSILADASLFWKSMARHCRELGESELSVVIEDYTDAYDDVDERVAAYLTPSFKEETVKYLASWKALEVICREYREETEIIKAEIYEAYESNPTTEQALKRAVELGSEVLADTDEEAARLVEAAAAIEKRKAATQNELDEFARAS